MVDAVENIAVVITVDSGKAATSLTNLKRQATGLETRLKALGPLGSRQFREIANATRTTSSAFRMLSAQVRDLNRAIGRVGSISSTNFGRISRSVSGTAQATRNLTAALRQFNQATSRTSGRGITINTRRARGSLRTLERRLTSLDTAFVKTGQVATTEFEKITAAILRTNNVIVGLSAHLRAMSATMRTLGRAAPAQFGQISRSANAATKSVQNQAQQINDAGNAVGRFGTQSVNTFTAVGRSIRTALGHFAAFAAISGTVTLFGGAVRSAIDFEDALIGVEKTTGLAGRALQELSDTIEELSTRVPNSADELLGFAQTAGQLGVRGVENLSRFAETIARLNAATTDFQGEEAALQLARILNVTQEGVENVDRLASVFVRLGNQFEVTEGQIASLTTELATQTAGLGFSSAELAGFSTAIASVGLATEVSGTQIGKTLEFIIRTINNGGVQLQRFGDTLGINVEMFQELFRNDPAQGLIEFFEALSRVGDDAIERVDELGLSGIRFAKVARPLKNDVAALREVLAVAGDEAQRVTALLIESEKAFGTTSRSAQILGNNLAVVFRGVVNQYLPGFNERLKSAIESLRGLVLDGERFTDTVQNIGNALEGVGKLLLAAFGVAIIRAIITNILSIGAAIVALRTQIVGLTTAISLLNPALSALLLLYGAYQLYDFASQTDTGRRAIERFRASIEKLIFVINRFPELLIDILNPFTSLEDAAAELDADLERRFSSINRFRDVRIAALDQEESINVRDPVEVAQEEVTEVLNRVEVRNISEELFTQIEGINLLTSAQRELVLTYDPLLAANIRYTDTLTTLTEAERRLANAQNAGNLADITSIDIKERARRTLEDTRRSFIATEQQYQITRLALGELTQAERELINTLDPIEALTIRLTAQQKLLTDARNRAVISIDRYNELSAKLEQQLQNEILVQQVLREFDTGRARAIQTIIDRLNPLIAINRRYRIEEELLTRALDAEGASSEEVEEQLRKLREERELTLRSVATYRSEVDGLVNAERELIEELRSSSDPWRQYEMELALVNSAMENAKDTTIDWNEVLEALRMRHSDLFPEFERQEKAAQDLAKSWEEAARRIDEAFADAWAGAFDSFEDFADQLENAFRQLLGELIHQAVTRPILVQLGLTGGAQNIAQGPIAQAFAQTYLGGFLATGGVSTGAPFSPVGGGQGLLAAGRGLFAGGFGQIPSNFANAFSGFSSQFGQGFTHAFGFGSGPPILPGPPPPGTPLTHPGGIPGTPSVGFSLGSAAANLLVTTVASYAGTAIGQSLFDRQANSSFGAILGAVIAGPIGAFFGGLLDSLFGSPRRDPRFTIDAVGGDVPEENTFARDDITVVSQSTLGGIRLITDKDLAEDFTPQQAQQVFDFFEAISEIENLIGESIRPEQLEELRRELLRQQELYRKNSFDFQDFIVERFETIFDTLGGEVNEAFDRLTEGVSQRELLANLDQFVGGAFTVAEATGEFRIYLDSLEDITREVTRVVPISDAYRGSLEDIGRAYEEYGTITVTVTETVSGLTLETIRMGQELIVVNDILRSLTLQTLELNLAGAEAAQELIQAQGSLEEFVETARTLSSSVNNLAGQLFGSYEDRIRQEQARLNDVNEAARELYRLELERYETAIEAAERLAGTFRELFLIGATPTQTFEFQQARYTELVEAARGGDEQAALALSEFAPVFLEEARSFYASGDAFQEIRRQALEDIQEIEQQFGSLMPPAMPELILSNALLEELVRHAEEQNRILRQIQELTFVTQIAELAQVLGVEVNELLRALGVSFSLIAQSIIDNLDLGEGDISDVLNLVVSVFGSNSPLITLLRDSPAQIARELFAFFSLLDTDRDNLVGVEELVAFGLTPEIANELIGALDRNADTFIDGVEVLSVLLDPANPAFQQILNLIHTEFNRVVEETFAIIQALDTDASDTLTVSELEAILETAGLSTEAAQLIVDAVDLNNDNQINRFELALSEYLGVDSATVQALNNLGITEESIVALLREIANAAPPEIEVNVVVDIDTAEDRDTETPEEREARRVINDDDDDDEPDRTIPRPPPDDRRRRLLGGSDLLPLQEGGIVTSATRALVGEAGPEAVVPLDRFTEQITRLESRLDTLIELSRLSMETNEIMHEEAQVARANLNESIALDLIEGTQSQTDRVI